MSILSTPLTNLVGCQHPIVQTGMGWVGRPKSGQCVLKCRSFGHLGLGNHDI